MKKEKKVRSKTLKQITIPPKIHEVISYLAYSFSSKVLERDDNKQDLYMLYVETIRKKAGAAGNKAGWWFIRFKWFLLTKYSKQTKRINREWEIGLENDPERTKRQSVVGYLRDVRYPRKKKK